MSRIIVDTCVSNSTLLHLYRLQLHFARGKNICTTWSDGSGLSIKATEVYFSKYKATEVYFTEINPMRCSALYHCWQLYTCTIWSDVAEAYRARNPRTQMALYERSIRSLVRTNDFLDKNYVITGCKAHRPCVNVPCDHIFAQDASLKASIKVDIFHDFCL